MTAGIERVRLGHRDIALRVRTSSRARRMLLRVALDGAVELVLPEGVSRRRGERFLDERSAWVLARLDALPTRIAFADGVVLPVLGVERRIRHRPDLTGRPRPEPGALVVPGPESELANRVRRWLAAAARDALGPRAGAMAATIGREVARVTVRDTRSRWGSCTAKASLSFSWRLVLAPPPVLDYVVAHEVAHLVELNHGPRFWVIVAELCPDYPRQRRWLRRHGPQLFLYG